MKLLIITIGLAVSYAPAVGAESGTCVISNIASLNDCINRVSQFSRLVFTADIQCSNDTNSCADGDKNAQKALLPIFGMKNKEIDGQGHKIVRQGGQRDHPVISVFRSENILVKNLTIDDAAGTPPCDLSEKKCANTVSVAESKSATLKGVNIIGGKGYVVRVWNTHGFTFDGGRIINAGILGLYVGHFQFGPSSGVRIVNSSIIGSRTNGIVIQGAYSNDPQKPILISGNTLRGNHWHGLWPIPGGVTSGGQIFIGSGSNIRVSDNKIEGSQCGNCAGSQHVTAIEIGDLAPPPAGVAGLQIDGNVFTNSEGRGVAIYQNQGTNLSDVVVIRNVANGFAHMARLKAEVREADNVVDPAPLSDPRR